MEHQVLIVVLDGDVSTAELAGRIEEIRNWPGVIGVRSIERVVEDIRTEQPKT